MTNYLLRIMQSIKCSGSILVAVVIISGSLILFEWSATVSPVHTWHARYHDPADYRFLAEHFWNRQHDPSSYSKSVSNLRWQQYLTEVPFRSIGIGTYYIMVDLLAESFHGRKISMQELGTIIPISLRILLAISCLFFFFSIKKILNPWQSLFVLLLLVAPYEHWHMSQYFLAEAYLRIAFILILAILFFVQQNKKASWPWTCCLFGCLLVASHIKVQWLLLAFGIFPFLLFLYLIRKEYITALLSVGLCIVIPASISTVNDIGWNTGSLTMGIGMHVARKTGAKNVHYTCSEKQKEHLSFCHKKGTKYGWWNVRMDDRNIHNEQLILDKYSRKYIVSNPKNILKNVTTGLRKATNFSKRKQWRFEIFVPFWVKTVVNVCTWILLLFGMLRKKTFLVSSYGALLWAVPAAGYIFAVGGPRYFLPMTMIPVAIACFVLWKEWTIFSKLFTEGHNRITKR